MLDYNEIMVAQQRYEDMRREVAEANRSRALLGSTQSGPMQRIVSAVMGMKQRMARTGTQAQPVGKAMPGKAA
ncbi:MAG: hypothetical protein R6W76_18245 [Caldilinea sp.]